jgi:hypothetical protein
MREHSPSVDIENVEPQRIWFSEIEGNSGQGWKRDLASDQKQQCRDMKRINPGKARPKE